MPSWIHFDPNWRGSPENENPEPVTPWAIHLEPIDENGLGDARSSLVRRLVD
jgi:hypothetical protein